MNGLIIAGAKKNGSTDKLTGQFVKVAQSARHGVEAEHLFNNKNHRFY